MWRQTVKRYGGIAAHQVTEDTQHRTRVHGPSRGPGSRSALRPWVLSPASTPYDISETRKDREKLCVWKLCMTNFKKIPNFMWYLPEKLTKFPNFTYLPENAPILHDNCPTNNFFFDFFWREGGTCPHPMPLPSPTPMSEYFVSRDLTNRWIVQTDRHCSVSPSSVHPQWQRHRTDQDCRSRDHGILWVQCWRAVLDGCRFVALSASCCSK